MAHEPISRTGQQPQKWHYYIALGVSLNIYLAALKYGGTVTFIGPSQVIAKILLIWVATLSFLFIYFRWNGPRHLRRFGDEIRILPYYRKLLAEAFFPEIWFSRFINFLLLSLVCVFVLTRFSFMAVFLFAVWGSAVYFGLAATYILSKLDAISPRATIIQRVLWTSIVIWIPLFLVAGGVMFRLASEFGLTREIGGVIFCVTTGVAIFVLSLYLPIRIAIHYYTRAMGELRNLELAGVK